MKRIVWALFAGVICSVICFIARHALVPNLGMPDLLASTFGNRMLIAFVIGISSLKMNRVLHGALIGFLVTFSFSLSMIPANYFGFGVYTTVGVVFGVLIDVFATNMSRK
ncbi:MAG TPA: hypothetical protein VF857_03625 [Spirochaetota bacterium]